MQQFSAESPARIDLGGGTLDMWPLYLRLAKIHPSTLNLAISIQAKVQLIVDEKVARGKESQITMAFKGGPKIQAPWRTLEGLNEDTFRWPILILKRLLPKAPTQNLSFLLHTESPKGAGLGGSSTLGVAFLTVIQAYLGDKGILQEPSIRLIRDLEAELLGIPTGLQDYVSAMYGGLQSIAWKPGDQHERHTLDPSLAHAFASRCLLFYSGASRQSGINNWAVFKAALDPHDDRILTHLEHIAIITERIKKALEAERWSDVAEELQQEWRVRKQLAPGVTTEPFERFLKKLSGMRKVAGKFCGAGGGGCFFVFFPEISEEEKTRFMAIGKQDGFQSLAFHAVEGGTRVQT